jgi:hypothetical protein
MTTAKRKSDLSDRQIDVLDSLDGVLLQGQLPLQEHARRTEGDHPMTKPTFVECASCAAKGGTPELCAACLHNRAAIVGVAERSRMRDGIRLVGESLLLMLLAGGMFFAAIVVALHIFTEEKAQYLTIGYYCAIHSALVRWIWKKLRLEKAGSE